MNPAVHRSEQGRPYDRDFFRRVVLTWLSERPARIGGAVRLAADLQRAELRRIAAQVAHGVPVPETAVVGLTTTCNLRCRACSEGQRRDGPAQALTPGQLVRLVDECRRLGIGRIALVGGEPLAHPQFDDLLVGHKDLFFAVFTNGRLATDERLARWRELGNAAFFVNISAAGRSTWEDGIEPGGWAALERFAAAGLLTGFAATVHRRNLGVLGRAETWERLASIGARFGMLFDYLPRLGVDDDPLVVERDQRAELVRAARQAAVRLGLPLLLAPEDEAAFGGCGAAGRGLIYVAPDGEIGPCPFASGSQAQLDRDGLLGALKSPFFRQLRTCLEGWQDCAHGCSLRANREGFADLRLRHQVSA